MKAIIKTIKQEIERRINTYTDEDKVRLYHVDITTGDDSLTITPKNGNTFYSIDELVKVARFFETTFYVTVDDERGLMFHIIKFH